MSDPSTTRSVRISDDERGGWSSDRPRRDGGRPERPVDISTRCRTLDPTDRMRYTPGSLVVIVSASVSDRDSFIARVVEDRGAVLGRAKVRALLAGRVPEEEVEERVTQLLDAAVQKKLGAGDSVVLAAEGLDADERERYVRMAHKLRRPRHMILLETARENVAEEDRVPVNELRKALEDGSLGQEGFQTALRLGGGTAQELKRIVFRPPPQDD